MKALYITLVIAAGLSLVACDKDKGGGAAAPPATDICAQLRPDTNYGNSGYNTNGSRYIDNNNEQYVRQNGNEYRNLHTNAVHVCTNVSGSYTGGHGTSSQCVEAIQQGAYHSGNGYVNWNGTQIYCGHSGTFYCQPGVDPSCPYNGGTLTNYYNVPGQWVWYPAPYWGYGSHAGGYWGFNFNFNVGGSWSW